MENMNITKYKMYFNIVTYVIGKEWEESTYINIFQVASLQKDKKLPIAFDRGSTDPKKFYIFSPIKTSRPQNHPQLKR